MPKQRRNRQCSGHRQIYVTKNKLEEPTKPNAETTYQNVATATKRQQNETPPQQRQQTTQRPRQRNNTATTPPNHTTSPPTTGPHRHSRNKDNPLNETTRTHTLLQHDHVRTQHNQQQHLYLYKYSKIHHFLTLFVLSLLKQWPTMQR